MSRSDPDGRIAQMLADMHTCLAIEMAESLREATERFDAVLGWQEGNQ